MAQNNQWEKQYWLEHLIPNTPEVVGVRIFIDDGLARITKGSAVMDIEDGHAQVCHRITAEEEVAPSILIPDIGEPVDVHTPDLDFIPVGPIKVKAISAFMKDSDSDSDSDFDDDKTAMLLVAPQEVAADKWDKSIKSICNNNAPNGVTQMNFWEFCRGKDPYERVCCNHISGDLRLADSHKGVVRTTAFMATEEIIMDHLYPKRDALAEQGAPFLKEIFAGEAEHKVWAANEHPVYKSNAKSIIFPSCASGWEDKNGSKQSAIMVALAFNHD